MMTNGLKLIGAAFPRTGTMSVKKALEILGIGQSYHMHEVFLNPSHISIWNTVIQGKTVDWQNLLNGYVATLDTPACHYWKELALAFPNAKILLLQRDPEVWYESVYSTIYQVITGPKGQTDPALQMVQQLFFNKCMDGHFEDKSFAVAKYRQYCLDVIENTPQERLLVYEVSQGWEPLCKFLQCDIPQEPFPKKNSRKEFCSRSNI